MGGSVADILKEWRELERRLEAADADERKAIKARIVDVRKRYLDAVDDVEASMMRQEPEQGD